MIRHKFNAKRIEANGIKFPSKKEYNYYRKLLAMQQSGEIVFFLRQPMFDLPGGVTYRADFVTFNADGSVHFIDVKGMKTSLYIAKKKLVEATYPIQIEET